MNSLLSQSNFAFLNKKYPEIFDRCHTAEQNLLTDYRISLTYARMGLELMLKTICKKVPQLSHLTDKVYSKNHPKSHTANIHAILQDRIFKKILDDGDLYERLFMLNKVGNGAVHNKALDQKFAAENITTLFEMACFFYNQFSEDDEEVYLTYLDWSQIPNVSVQTKSLQQIKNIEEKYQNEKDELLAQLDTAIKKIESTQNELEKQERKRKTFALKKQEYQQKNKKIIEDKQSDYYHMIDSSQYEIKAVDDSKVYKLTQLESAQLYTELSEIIPKDSKIKINKIHSVFYRLLNILTQQQEKQFFLDDYSKVNYLVQVDPAMKSQEARLNALRKTTRRYQKSYSRKPSEKEVNACLHILCYLIDYNAPIEMPQSLREKIQNINPDDIVNRVELLEEIPCLKLSFLKVIKKDTIQQNGQTLKSKLIECNAEDYGIVFVEVTDFTTSKNAQFALTENLKYLNSNYTFNITDLLQIDENRYKTTENSLIISCPDYLIDATSLAGCIVGKLKSNPFLAIIKRLQLSNTTLPMLHGGVVNDLFDCIIADPEVSCKDAKEAVLKDKEVQCALFERQELKESFKKLNQQFVTMKQVTEPAQFEDQSITTEPSFLSTTFGLQGRLDAIVHHANDPDRKDIIELKSTAKPANASQLAYNNELAQVACYDLMLMDTFPDRVGTNSILYSQAKEKPLRNCGRQRLMQQTVMLARNQLIRIEQELAMSNIKIFDRLKQNLDDSVPSYMKSFANHVVTTWETAREDVRLYFIEFIGLITRENMFSKIGTTKFDAANGDYGGQSALWKTSLQHKKDSYNTLVDLKINSFDTDNNKVHFERSQKEIDVSTIRVGDMIVIYPYSKDNIDPLSNQLIKGNISDISKDEVIITVKNKFVDPSYFEAFELWAVESDYVQHGFTQQYASLFAFLSTDKAKQDLLLGLQKPTFGEAPFLEHNDEISEEQRQILSNAISAKDYFLLQGPPGTGKTSKMIKNMVKHIYENTEEVIVLLAFTNRATEEICDKVLDFTEDFVKLGHVKTNSKYAPYTLGYLDYTKIRESKQKARIYISTVNSFYRYMEYVRAFDTVIIDEASQLLEPQVVGILSMFRRFILVGDERQLPAIVSQPAQFHTTEKLQKINISDLSISIFERLLINAQNKGWDNAYHMLSKQYRTHRDISTFCSNHFYDKKLKHAISAQEYSLQERAFYDRGEKLTSLKYFDLVSTRRLFAINTPKEKAKKYNLAEANIVVELLKTIRQALGDRFTEKSVGVITPFRAQIAEIKKLLEQEGDLLDKVTVDTVERYQGSERDVIIISFAINDPLEMQNLQAFNKDQTVDRKLNVAMTRAKEQLIIVGHKPIVSKGRFHKKLYEYIDVIVEPRA